MDTIEKVYCTGHGNNDALVAALASKNNCDPMAMAAMMNQNDCMNNQFAYLIWMIFAMRNICIAELLLPDTIEHYQDGLRESTWAEGHC